MMEEDTDLRSAITYADSVAVLQVLGNERDDGWVVDEERSGAIGSASVGVTWRYRMTHDWEPKFDPTEPQAELRGSRRPAGPWRPTGSASSGSTRGPGSPFAATSTGPGCTRSSASASTGASPSTRLPSSAVPPPDRR